MRILYFSTHLYLKKKEKYVTQLEKGKKRRRNVRQMKT